ATCEVRAVKAKLIKAAKLVGVVSLVGFMLNTLLMLAELKGLDSRLSENERLLSRAVELEESMGEKGGNLAEMSEIFDGLMAGIQEANEVARTIVSDAEEIRAMNDTMLAVNREIDGIILANIAMVEQISLYMAQVVAVMGDVGNLLSGIMQAASGQLQKVEEMYRLAQENNQSTPALP
ncbi:MAG: hypothetical protein QME89_10030, partial [Actinomycetota bacterium]|nr:hypothetical protein [Actinomycetota bacterium]